MQLIHENDFPDSSEKEFLRKVTLKRIILFAKSSTSFKGSYFGLPGVELKDVVCWKEVLNRVTAVERDSENTKNMIFNRNHLGLTGLVNVVNSDVYEQINKSHSAYDIYNMDFLGGFLYEKDQNADALKKIFLNQKLEKKDFILIYTFKLRDKGGKEYVRVLDDLCKSFRSDYLSKEIALNRKDNAEDFSMLLKTAFLAEILTNANANSYVPTFYAPVRYVSGRSNSMIYFYTELRYQGGILASHDINGFKNILEMQVLKLKGNQMETHVKPNDLIRR